MNRTNFEHAIYALLMQLPFGLLGHWWMGAAFAIGFFLGREHAQVQHEIQDATSYDEAYGIEGDFAAFKVWKWSLDAQLDLLLPVVAVVIVAVVLPEPDFMQKTEALVKMLHK
jgi:hypothetical protein